MSVDLSGSTAYKNSSIGLTLEGGVPLWVSAFRKFYEEFPSLLAEIHQSEQVKKLAGGECPHLWKAIGDELVFCSRVRSRRQIALSVNIFVAALHQYRATLKAEGDPFGKLDVKGAAWLAAFPTPNLAVRLRHPGDPEYLSMSEALEAAADERPFEHDFLGKAIDTGFRVAGTAGRSRFALSVQLARVLLSLKPPKASSHAVRVDPPILLKGVNDGAPYPALYIDTMEGNGFENVRVRERDLFGSGTGDATKIKAYLDEYCHAVGTEEIYLRDDLEDGEQNAELSELCPESYLKLRKSLIESLEKERGRGAENQDDGNDPDDESTTAIEKTQLNPASTKL